MPTRENLAFRSYPLPIPWTSPFYPFPYDEKRDEKDKSYSNDKTSEDRYENENENRQPSKSKTNINQNDSKPSYYNQDDDDDYGYEWDEFLNNDYYTFDNVQKKILRAILSNKVKETLYISYPTYTLSFDVHFDKNLLPPNINKRYLNENFVSFRFPKTLFQSPVLTSTTPSIKQLETLVINTSEAIAESKVKTDGYLRMIQKIEQTNIYIDNFQVVNTIPLQKRMENLEKEEDHMYILNSMPVLSSSASSFTSSSASSSASSDSSLSSFVPPPTTPTTSTTTVSASAFASSMENLYSTNTNTNKNTTNTTMLNRLQNINQVASMEGLEKNAVKDSVFACDGSSGMECLHYMFSGESLYLGIQVFSFFFLFVVGFCYFYNYCCYKNKNPFRKRKRKLVSTDSDFDFDGIEIHEKWRRVVGFYPDEDEDYQEQEKVCQGKDYVEGDKEQEEFGGEEEENLYLELGNQKRAFYSMKKGKSIANMNTLCIEVDKNINIESRSNSKSNSKRKGEYYQPIQSQPKTKSKKTEAKQEQKEREKEKINGDRARARAKSKRSRLHRISYDPKDYLFHPGEKSNFSLPILPYQGKARQGDEYEYLSCFSTIIDTWSGSKPTLFERPFWGTANYHTAGSNFSRYGSTTATNNKNNKNSNNNKNNINNNFSQNDDVSSLEGVPSSYQDTDIIKSYLFPFGPFGNQQQLGQVVQGEDQDFDPYPFPQSYRLSNKYLSNDLTWKEDEDEAYL